MVRRWEFATAILFVMLVPMALLVMGCGGSGDDNVFLNVSERPWWGTGGEIAFASFGGNGQLYVYSINEDGGGLFLLTPSDNDDDFADEGGRHPAFRPDADQLVIASRRGNSEGLYLIDDTRGDRDGVTVVTDVSGIGADSQPSYSPDGLLVFFTSTRLAGDADIYSIANPVPAGAKADARVAVVSTPAEEQWAAVSPDGTKVAYQSDTNGNTDIWVKDIGTPPGAPGTCLTVASPYRDEAPSWSPDGTKIAFHSNRAGDFDIWLMDADGTDQVAVTADQRSDGYPSFGPDGDRLAIVRDRELWTVPADAWVNWQANADDESERLTRRY